MTVKKLTALILFSVLFLAPSFALATIDIEVKSKDANNWGIQGSDLDQFSLSDCESNVEFDVKITLAGESITQNVYLYYGSSCGVSTSTADTCTQIGDSVPSSSTTVEFANIKTQDMFGENCTESSALLWVKIASQNGVTDDNGDYNTVWSQSFPLTYDTAGPAAPEDITVLTGSKKVIVSWKKLDAASEYVVIYWNGNSSTSSGGTDLDGGSSDEECNIAGGFAEGDDFDLDRITFISDSTPLTKLQIDGLTNGSSYNFAVLSLDEAGNPSNVSNVVCAIPEETSDFWEIFDAAGGDDSDGAYCFIATAAFGSYSHPIVKILRNFRDSFLTKLPGGHSAVKAYYAVGPALAAAVDENSFTRSLIAGLLSIFAGFTVLLVSIGPAGFIAGFGGSVFLGLLFGALIPRRRRN